MNGLRLLSIAQSASSMLWWVGTVFILFGSVGLAATEWQRLRRIDSELSKMESKLTTTNGEPSNPSLQMFTSATQTSHSFVPTTTSIVAVVLCLCAFGSMLHSLADNGEYHGRVIEMRDIHILDQYSKNLFRADVANSSGLRQAFVLNFCDYSDITPEIQPGVQMDMWYMEDRVHGYCFDVSPGQDRGYTLRRINNGPNAPPVIHDWKVNANAGQAAAPCATETEARSFRP